MNKKRTQQFFINLRKQKSYYKAKTWEDEYKIQVGVFLNKTSYLPLLTILPAFWKIRKVTNAL